MKPTGVKESLTSANEPTVPSGPVKIVGQPGVASDQLISSKPEGLPGANSKAIKPILKRGSSSDVNIAGGWNGSASAAAKGKSIVADEVGNVLTFKEVTLGPNDGEVRFRLIHFWEATNPITKTLIGIEMLLIDEEETVIQGFIPPGRCDTYLRHLKAGATYRLTRFFGSQSKNMYSVADPSVTISFSWNSVLSEFKDSTVCFPVDRFRVHSQKEFEAAADKRGDLYDYIGHIKLVNGEVPNDKLLIDEAGIAVTRRLELHVQTHDDPVVKLNLWDKAAFEFCAKFKASGGTASVILVTTLNPKRFGGVFSLSSTTASRVFIDLDIQETRSYLSWLESNFEVANRVNATVVTKPEPATLGDILAYMKQASAKVALFQCTATIDDIVHGAGWYYIGCRVCHTKAIKGATTLMCKKCGKNEIQGVPLYHSKLSVYDHKDQAVFVLLGDAGEELTGKKAAELVDNYYEAKEIEDEDHIVPVPQALIGTIGQTRKFVVMVSAYNLSGKSQTLTVTKVLHLDTEDPVVNIGDAAEEATAKGREDHAEESVKRGGVGIEGEGAKRTKHG
ncbi:unnamed protein product [Eruca vesicaria subsp. sativa]|uniref:Replication factor A C-terminal domain-containing protein n=1 Tax=Eruca vesicaria subsp. sativa TaxID=29727 RepID=A0ABC8JWP4_ERUVS|nr:unnamed protein product [Eruca vesicaria subsp. sativa]